MGAVPKLVPMTRRCTLGCGGTRHRLDVMYDGTVTIMLARGTCAGWKLDCRGSRGEWSVQARLRVQKGGPDGILECVHTHSSVCRWPNRPDFVQRAEGSSTRVVPSQLCFEPSLRHLCLTSFPGSLTFQRNQTHIPSRHLSPDLTTRRTAISTIA